MAKLSDLIISNPEVTTFPELELLVRLAGDAGPEVFGNRL